MMPKGFKHSEKTKQIMSASNTRYWLGKKRGSFSKETKLKMSITHLKRWSNNKTLWSKEYKRENLKKWRHLKGISKRYRENIKRIPPKFYKQRYKSLKKAAGPLTIQAIQQVYEDNIKRHGTLTCYLCLEPILFGSDHLEHKTPLSRSGTNVRKNLDIACQKCNNKKYNKTEEEYRKELRS